MLGRERTNFLFSAIVAMLAACTHHHNIGMQDSGQDTGSSATETGTGGTGLGGTGGSPAQVSFGGAVGGGTVLGGSRSAGGTVGLGGAIAGGGVGGATLGGGGATAMTGGGGSTRGGGGATAMAGSGGSSPAGVGGVAGAQVGGSGGRATGGFGGLAAGGNAPAYGGAAGSSTVVSGSEPSDTRPSAPAWTPPFAENLGAPGWQQSSQPICNANQGAESIPSVWVDDRGVFALVGADCDESAGVPCGKDGASLRLNAGSGWQPYFQFPPTAVFWTYGATLWGGFPNGPLFVSGDFTQHSLAFVDKGSAEITGSDAELQSAFVVGNGVAYAVWDGLRKYSAGTWSTVADTGWGMLTVWADAQTLIACGYNQTILVKNGSGDLTQLTGVPAGIYTAVWAFAADDVWFGNGAAQLLHYDGKNWKIYPTESRDISFSGITQLWGSSGILYFSTNSEFGRWNGTSIEMLLQPPADADMSAVPAQFGRFWGTSPTNVFVPVRDSRFAQYTCGGIFVLWFDGTEFHRF